MAAISPNTIVRESMGSSTLLICGMTSSSTSDTWTPSEVIPVLDYWTQEQAGAGYNEPDTSYNPTSGVFTFISGTSTSSAWGGFKLFILAKT